MTQILLLQFAFMDMSLFSPRHPSSFPFESNFSLTRCTFQRQIYFAALWLYYIVLCLYCAAKTKLAKYTGKCCSLFQKRILSCFLFPNWCSQFQANYAANSVMLRCTVSFLVHSIMRGNPKYSYSFHSETFDGKSDAQVR